MKRRQFLQALGVGACAFWAGCSSKQRSPNFIVVLIDDMGWTDAGCYGSSYYQTPHIDRLAAEGMKFTNGYAACAVCSPTRAALMTGRYPARIGITDWIRARFQGGEIPDDQTFEPKYVGGPDKELLCPQNPLWMELDEVTIAEVLKPKGYVSCHIGKWHLGADPWYPDKQGFDYNIGGCDYGQPPSYFDPYRNQRLDGIPNLEPREQGEYLTDREADEAVHFIMKHRNQPFFLYLAHYAVHTPIQAKQKLTDKYRNMTATTAQNNPEYAAMVESVDHALGKVLRTLDELDLTDDTFVLFTSDNGGLLPKTSNQPLRSGKGFPYEGGIREPFIVRWPGNVAKGTVNDTPVCSIDVLPTIAEIAGLLLPESRTIDGQSIVPLLTGKGDWQRDALFWHFPHYRYGQEVPYSIVRQGDWKLIKRYTGKPFELYNLSDDLSETTDLSETLPDKVTELDDLLADWLTSTGARMPKPNPDYNPSL
ncbi:sulfatase-like hydrolase/transferase [candidate division KSB1 bacterium]|nr:sulfatase-like hydrolase/transferase [candidate division KSB1 bacterium]